MSESITISCGRTPSASFSLSLVNGQIKAVNLLALAEAAAKIDRDLIGTLDVRYWARPSRIPTPEQRSQHSNGRSRAQFRQPDARKRGDPANRRVASPQW
jgi:hypothetical protein